MKNCTTPLAEDNPGFCSNIKPATIKQILIPKNRQAAVWVDKFTQSDDIASLQKMVNKGTLFIIEPK